MRRRPPREHRVVADPGYDAPVTEAGGRLSRLPELVEQGMLPIDDPTLKDRLATARAGREEKARDERLDTSTARLRLTPRAEPYWRTIQEGHAIGYRRLASGKAGTWVARHYDPAEGRRYEALGAADDMLAADGTRTLT